MFIGAPQVDVGSALEAGAVYVFSLAGCNLQQTLVAMMDPNPGGDHFGQSVAVGSNIAVIGAPIDEDDADRDFPDGSAYVFEFIGTAWVQTQKLTESDAIPPCSNDTDDAFGHAIAIDSAFAVVVSSFPEGNDAGAGFVFEDLADSRPVACCPWDLDGDGVVGITDFLALLALWGNAGCPPEADFDGDNVVGIVDMLEMLGNFAPCP